MESDDRLRHERPTVAHGQRLSPASRRTWLVWDLLGESSQQHHRAASGLQQLLDGQSLSHPNAPNGTESPKHLATDTIPINRFNVRSIIVRPEPNEIWRPGRPNEIQGVAFDSGHGITRVEVSPDGGATWKDARLDAEIGKYSWRRWRANWTPERRGKYRLMARAANAIGETRARNSGTAVDSCGT